MDYGSTGADELAGLCVNAGNDAAWQEFVRRFQRPIALVVLRTSRGWGEPSTSAVDDLVQETFLRLCADDCRLLRGFVARQPGSILGYLKVIAASVTHDHFRSHTSLKRGGDLRRLESDTDGTENLAGTQNQLDRIETGLQVDEIDRMLQALAPEALPDRDRTIFWLYYQQGFSAREISQVPEFGLTVKGVESSIHRTTNLVRQTLRQKGVCPPTTISREVR
jgi:RNA polymerase sigma-70 factor (ECF subfamily)